MCMLTGLCLNARIEKDAQHTDLFHCLFREHHLPASLYIYKVLPWRTQSVFYFIIISALKK